jgi:hypothetical protein
MSLAYFPIQCKTYSNVGAYRSAVLFTFLICSSLSFAQQGPTQNGQRRVQPRPVMPPPPQAQPQPPDPRRMELEERRRLRQEIQRHGPDYRVKEASVMPNAASAVLPAQPALPQPVPLQPLPSYFGPPVFPAGNANSGPPNLGLPNAVPPVPGAGISRGPALSQEERQQLRQQIRDERKRGLYPTPSEVER